MIALIKTRPRPLGIAPTEQGLLGLLIAVSLLLFVAQGYRISGDCMQPHLRTGERIVVAKLAYALHGPRRGDVVVFLYPRDPSQTFVKRIVGLPGDTIAIHAGRVFIDGGCLPEPYCVNPSHGDMSPQFVPHGSYFVMGDNRDFSDDSRYWGDLPRRDLMGRAVACYWPPRDFALLK